MDTTRPDTTPRPLTLRTRHVPAGRLALAPDRERQALSALASIALHGALILAILWGGMDLIEADTRTPGGPGPRGGGGGGGAERVVYFELPALATPAPTAPVAPEEVVFRPPDPNVRDLEIDIPKVEVPQSQIAMADYGSVLGRGVGTGTGPGSGSGSGGGVGSGVGTGIGDSIGPGTGGEGGRVFIPIPRDIVLAPFDDVPGFLKGREVAVTFYVDAGGKVVRIETVPRFGGDYWRRFREAMMSFRFQPALTLEGKPVAASTVIMVRLPG